MHQPFSPDPALAHILDVLSIHIPLLKAIRSCWCWTSLLPCHDGVSVCMAVTILQQWVMVDICWRNDRNVVGMWNRWAKLLTSHRIEAVVLCPVGQQHCVKLSTICIMQQH